MTFSWQEMTPAEFASYERILGCGIVQVNGVYWRRVRPLFCRPLLPFQELEPERVKPPATTWLGGFQHAVPSATQANSRLNLMMFEDAKNYSPDSLDYNRKRQVKLAAKQFVIRPVDDLNEFKRKAYPIYLSFYERTQYQFGTQRRNQACFSQWADALMQIPKVLVLGGYRNGELGGVSASMLIGGTLDYAMFFCDNESLRLGLSDLMLHSVRETAAESRCAGRIFTGLHKGGKGLDDFYLLRGCKVIEQPAFLHLNPVTKLLLKNFASESYARLLGHIGSSPSEAVAKAGTREPVLRRPAMSTNGHEQVPRIPKGSTGGISN